MRLAQWLKPSSDKSPPLMVGQLWRVNGSVYRFIINDTSNRDRFIVLHIDHGQIDMWNATTILRGMAAPPGWTFVRAWGEGGIVLA